MNLEPSGGQELTPVVEVDRGTQAAASLHACRNNG